MKWLVFGYKGWIGQQVVNILESDSDSDSGEHTVITSDIRADDEKNVEKLLQDVQPDRVMSLIGRTHGPGYTTIDYLEQKGKIIENVRDNLYGPLVLGLLCKKHNIHYTYLGTGCIFSGYDKEYTEESSPDFFGSSYSVVKGFTDRLMKQLDEHVLNVRIRMPITSEKDNVRNFIYKITHYEKICSMENSMTVLPELLPLMVDMAVKKQTGTINLTNPGAITHNDILEMYKEIVDPAFTWQNFSVEEQDKILLSGRSNNVLETTKLQELYPNVKPIKESIREVLENYK
jgi:nucleoside-diphosphate-sugar epimerase